MSFKFDQEYLDMLKAHEQELVKEGLSIPESAFAAYLDWIEGNMLCACDHGCNGTTLDNGPKMLAIIRAQKDGVNLEVLNAMVMKDPQDFGKEMYEKMWQERKQK